MAYSFHKLLNLRQKASFQDLTPSPPPRTITFTPRPIRLLFPAQATPEGSGMIVHRSIGSPTLRTLSPFLLLDHATVRTSEGGFPDHPHRGIETISYILSGSLSHEDFAGNSGVLRKGDLQFMTAGRGIMHSEMPIPLPPSSSSSGDIEPGEGEPSEGLQLWVDLPVGRKMCEPRYRDVRGPDIPVAKGTQGVSVKVISGVSFGVKNLQELAYTPVWYLDFTVQPGGIVRQGIPVGWNAFLYVISGTLKVLSGDEGEHREANTHDLVVFEQVDGDCFEASVGVEHVGQTRFVFVAGQPLDQGVAQYGPFVMTTRAEIVQARMDWSRYENGFERARGWESKAEKRRRSLC